MKALLFGSIGTLVDTSHLQFEAYDLAFQEAGVGWTWTREDYERLLAVPGGRDRLRRQFTTAQGVPPDEDLLRQVHARKGELFRDLVAERAPGPRPGVCRMLETAGKQGMAIGVVTTTDMSNVQAMIELLAPAFTRSDFKVVTHRDSVDASKPDPQAWHVALAQLGIEANQAVAIEDTGSCVDSAVAAGLFTVATPNAFAGGQDFRSAQSIVDCLGDRSCAARQLAGLPIVADGTVSLALIAEHLAVESA